ncbi:hypothetical protein TRSC58_01984 [Trypanosoma rangeli SC58]|uniref:Uncharacterized protein n=1 Tax=Trypanosoma rangeli SC58 TaxID=429131 RepID=A0A061J839_TRYRA|nr:hypothetical protein TRSC58_01984 [Trypanosoma rangeli SC58]
MHLRWLHHSLRVKPGRRRRARRRSGLDAPSALPLAAPHDFDSMTQAERALLTASEELSQSSSPVAPPREDEDERRSCATPSPTRRELEEFFPITAAKRSRQACVAEASCRRRRCMEVHNSSAGGEGVITATDILAAIPCLSSNIVPPATRVGAVGCEEKPRGCVRSYNRRQLDYAADAPKYARAGEAAQDGCTPSVYWEIAFPRDPNGYAPTDDEQRG